MIKAMAEIQGLCECVFNLIEVAEHHQAQGAHAEGTASRIVGTIGQRKVTVDIDPVVREQLIYVDQRRTWLTFPPPSGNHRHDGPERHIPVRWSVSRGQRFPGVVRGLARAVRCCAHPSTDPRPIGTLLPGAPVFQPPPSPSRRHCFPVSVASESPLASVPGRLGRATVPCLASGRARTLRLNCSSPSPRRVAAPSIAVSPLRLRRSATLSRT